MLGKLTPVDVRLTRQAWKILERRQHLANGAIEPVSNLDHWGTTLDHWDYPVDGKGDCKIYALFKRKLLIERGFPRQALLMTIVRDLNGQGHAVLTVKTDRGDFVLDNLADEIRPWNATGYTFFKRQAQDDPNVWLSLGGATGAAPPRPRASEPRTRDTGRDRALPLRRAPAPVDLARLGHESDGRGGQRSAAFGDEAVVERHEGASRSAGGRATRQRAPPRSGTGRRPTARRPPARSACDSEALDPDARVKAASRRR